MSNPIRTYTIFMSVALAAVLMAAVVHSAKAEEPAKPVHLINVTLKDATMITHTGVPVDVCAAKWVDAVSGESNLFVAEGPCVGLVDYLQAQRGDIWGPGSVLSVSINDNNINLI